jgi:hypothetical protein
MFGKATNGQYDDQADSDGDIPLFPALANPYKKYVMAPGGVYRAHP